MFTQFFYYLKSKRLDVSINEWLTLTEALNKGLANDSFIGFYNLCKSILIKSETNYDNFDMAFLMYFKKINEEKAIPDELWQWLNKSNLEEKKIDDEINFIKLGLDELKKKFKERLEEQKEEHNGGSYWIGTGGTSIFGHGGQNPSGIRVGGKSSRLSALQIAGERHFRDFRKDNVLGIRQFQMAFRKLRQYSGNIDGPKTELNITETIDETCKNAGNLKLVWERPRKNTVQLLLLIDSDGSMLPYMNMCNRLFQAVAKSSHFKDLKVFYFHNCIYDKLYTDPYCVPGKWVDTRWVMKNYGSDYKVIVIGDASMAPMELMSRGGNNVIGLYNEVPGINWLEDLARLYTHSIWLNPIPKKDWNYVFGEFTLNRIRQTFYMYDLTLDGLEEGIKKLLVNK